MADSLDRQLLRQARRLARLDPNRPQQGNLRRAVSTAYYGLFHFLVNHACRAVLGTSNDLRPYRNILARAYQHGVMASACKSFAGTTLPKSIQKRLPAGFKVPPDLTCVAQTFRDAQEKRHLADYDPGQHFRRSDVLALIRDIEDAITSFSNIQRLPETKFFLVALLVWNTLTNR